MKILFYTFLVVFSINTMDKCERENPNGNYGSLGETIDLQLEKTIEIKDEGLSVTFVSNMDSRCPTGVNCIQAGKANVTLKAVKEGKEESLELEAKGMCESDDGSCGSEGRAHNYTIKLINVYPYPVEPKPNDAGPVSAKLIISK